MTIENQNQRDTVADYLAFGEVCFEEAGLFFGHGTDNGWDEAVALLTHVLNITPFADQSLLSYRLTEQEKLTTEELFQRRVTERIPAAYLVGQAWFAGLPFHVTRDVLIPRSPIAELITSQFHPWLIKPPRRILDLCTGSGCIGISCAYAFPEAEVVLSDLSVKALAIADQNILQHQLQDRVRTIESDLFDNLAGQQFDLIVTNPPYVDAGDFANMPPEYHHEPELGLVSGADGLDFTRRLLAEAADHLTENGLLIAEVGNSWVSLEKAYPQTAFNWVEFEQGGFGVFVLEKADIPVGYK